jgi:hypothetical protein
MDVRNIQKNNLVVHKNVPGKYAMSGALIAISTGHLRINAAWNIQDTLSHMHVQI